MEKKWNLPIRSERLLIRRFDQTDAEDFAGFMTDPESTEFLTFDKEQKSHEGAIALLETTIESYDTQNPLLAFAVENQATHEFIGFCGLTPREEDMVEIMYAVMPHARGKGYAVEIAVTLARHAIGRIGYRRVIAPISPAHSISMAVAVKAGFRDHGLGQNPNSGETVRLFVFDQKHLPKP